jgi:hypothetical protein
MSRKLDYKDPAGDMAKSQLQKIEAYAKKLNDMIHPDDELESWVQSKLSRISTDIGDVKHYLDYELKKMEIGGDVSEFETFELNKYSIFYSFKNENNLEVGILTIYASTEEEAKEIAENKYSPYYELFEIFQIDVEENDFGMENIPTMEESAAMQYNQGGAINEIRYYSKWKALKDFTIGIDSNSRNPNTKSLLIPKGTILTWEEDSPSGNVWFLVEINGIKYRGKIQSGRITNVINSGKIELLNNGYGIRAYSGEFLQKLLK